MEVTTHAQPPQTRPQEGAPAVSAEGTPDWVGEMWRKYSTRVRDYFHQAFTLLVRPGRFMEEWATGQRETLNPVRFLGIGFLLELAVRYLGERFLIDPALKLQEPASFVSTLLGVQLIFLVLTLPMHAVMRVSGSRAPLSATAAALIFAFMGPIVLIQTLGWIISAALLLITGSVPLMPLEPGVTFRIFGYSAYPVVPMALNSLSIIYCVRALAGVHGRRWVWAILANVVAHTAYVPFIEFATRINAQRLSALLERLRG